MSLADNLIKKFEEIKQAKKQEWEQRKKAKVEEKEVYDKAFKKAKIKAIKTKAGREARQKVLSPKRSTFGFFADAPTKSKPKKKKKINVFDAWGLN